MPIDRAVQFEYFPIKKIPFHKRMIPIFFVTIDY